MNDSHGTGSESADAYLRYLDKEMTIMGFLSTFCVAVPALVLERLASATADELKAVWDAGECFFWAGSLLLLFAAALYYKQRSLLAYYYGRIALPDVGDGMTVEAWKEHADSWTTWIPYHFAHWFGIAAVVEYILGFASRAYCSIHESICWCVAPIFIAAIVCVAFVWFAKDRAIRWRDNPWLRRLVKK